MKTNSILSMTMIASVIAVSFTSCKKDDPVVEQEYQAKVMIKEGETVDLKTVATNKLSEGKISRSGNVYSIRNFRQMDSKDVEKVSVTYYFDFKENDAVIAEKAPLILEATQRNMDIKANTEEGYTLFYTDKGFEAVTQDIQSFIALSGNKAGVLTSFSPAGTIGWGNYRMSDHFILPVENRTFILAKDGKAFFKFRINSIYKDETPESDYSPMNYVYYSIDYKEFK